MYTPKIKFVFDRKKTASKTHRGVVELRITYGRTQKFISMGFTVYPIEWDAEDQSVRGIPEALQINEMLARTREKTWKIINSMEAEGRIDIQEIPVRLKSKSVNETFIDYIVKRMHERNVRENTKRAHGVFYNKFAEYGKIRLFSDVTEKNIMDFDKWLHEYTWTELDKSHKKITRRYSQASIGSFHKNLKAFISDAIIDGHIKENPYITKRIKIDKGKTRIDKFLLPSEIDRIKRAEMGTRRVEEARDIFVFACMTGLSYADLMEFNPKAIRDVDGIKMYTSERVKTSQQFACVIPEDAIKILKKYQYQLPYIPNQQYNLLLKIVAQSAGINKPITSHYARHSAAMMWLNQGIPLEVVARCLGHSAVSTTLKSYAEVLDKTVANAFKKKM